MYDILVYLFEHCQRQELRLERAHMAKKLSAAGFDEPDISEALTWLAGVVRGPHRSLAPLPGARAAARVYAPRELARLDAECRGLIERLEHSAILTPRTREHVIERALAACTGEPLSAAQLKLIVLMVLWNEETPTSRLVVEELLKPAGARLPS
jgi:Smg protein